MYSCHYLSVIWVKRFEMPVGYWAGAHVALMTRSIVSALDVDCKIDPYSGLPMLTLNCNKVFSEVDGSECCLGYRSYTAQVLLDIANCNAVHGALRSILPVRLCMCNQVSEIVTRHSLRRRSNLLFCGDSIYGWVAWVDSTRKHRT